MPDSPAIPDKLHAALIGSFIGDALPLGIHWIYNPAKIQRLHGRATDYIDPSANQYHAARKTGDLSHYGDQTLALMRSLEPGAGFSLEAFAGRWEKMWAGYEGYLDSATKDTLSNLETGKEPGAAASNSNDIAGASRIAPLLIALADRPESELIDAAKAQAGFTHGDPGVIESAAFFAIWARRLIEGADFHDALDAARAIDFKHHNVDAALAQAREGLATDTVEWMQKLGLTCHLPDAFPATLYLLLKYEDDFESALIENGMAGGDSCARGSLIGLILGALHGTAAIPQRWIDGLNATGELRAWLASHDCQCGVDAVPDAAPGTNKVEFQNANSETLAARLEWPTDGSTTPKGIAIFAHCFTCSKDLPATTRISRELAKKGFAVLRFDFTGLGSSDGDFANTNFSSNVEDLVAAAEHIRNTIGEPDILIGHSLGGAAVLAAASKLPKLKGIVTIAAPSDPEHISGLLSGNIDAIEADGEATVNLAGREFTIKKHFLDDIRSQNVLESLRKFRGSILIMHAPGDQTVSIDHAGEIYSAARHPKSFLSLADADHLLTRPADSEFAAEMIAAWAKHLCLD